MRLTLTTTTSCTIRPWTGGHSCQSTSRNFPIIPLTRDFLDQLCQLCPTMRVEGHKALLPNKIRAGHSWATTLSAATPSKSAGPAAPDSITPTRADSVSPVGDTGGWHDGTRGDAWGEDAFLPVPPPLVACLLRSQGRWPALPIAGMSAYRGGAGNPAGGPPRLARYEAGS